MSVLDKIDEALDEAYQKVDIEGLPSIIMKGSAGTVRMQIKKKLKKPDDIKSIEKITVGDMKKYFRELAAGGGEEEASEAKTWAGSMAKAAKNVKRRSKKEKEEDIKKMQKKIRGIKEGKFVKGFWFRLFGRGGHDLDSKFARTNKDAKKILSDWASTGFADGDTIRIEKGDAEV